MTTLPEIESAIQQLPESDVRQFSEWIQAYVDEMWDRQIESDLASGKLDHLIARAEVDISANRVKNLNEIFLLN
jgi:thiaminase